MGSESYTLKDSSSLDPLINLARDKRIVMLGEATHGTHEFYTWRAAISKRLIAEHGFNFIAVEGDWPDCYLLNRYIKNYPDSEASALHVLQKFSRWPTWMWANYEVMALAEWLKKFNSGIQHGKLCGFYGLDVYSLWDSMHNLLEFLSKKDPDVAKVAKRAIDCFSGVSFNEQQYALSAHVSSCEDDVVKLLREVRAKVHSYSDDPEAAFSARQNAHVAVEAEKYYRHMVMFDDETWNIRDSHMMDTLSRLMDHYGPESKAIVWEHNTHIGDARFTPMKHSGLYNIGQLARGRFGQHRVLLVGFGTYQGQVWAGRQWGAAAERMRVPPAREGSLEHLLHSQHTANRYTIFSEDDKLYEQTWPHRAIGVVYEPENERGNYVPSTMNKRYDAFVYIDHTTALHALHNKADINKMPDTYPFEF